MANAQFAIGSFHGGEISAVAQGRFDKPDYRTSLKVCFNAFPIEAGAWGRRPGTQYAGHTRLGAPGRVMKFDFQQQAPYTLELTDGKMRFRTGTSFVMTNDKVGVVTISTANPAVIQLAAAVGWQTTDTMVFAANPPALLQNRQLTLTRIDGTHFSLSDPLTQVGIDGSALGTLPTGMFVTHIQEVSTPYIGGSWANVRAVQAEKVDIMLEGSTKPQALTVSIPNPLLGTNPVFSMADVIFNDGPYLDPFTNGVLATPGATSGIISIQLSFPAYSATKAYASGSFVTYSGVNYVSITDQNVNNQPNVSPFAWQVTTAAAAINDGQGFLGTDIGRQVRLFSEPALWSAATTYATGVTVSYNPSGAPGAATYWQAIAGSTGVPPGSDLIHWQIIPQGAAIWTWGRITSLSNVIDRNLAGSSSIGDLSGGGGTTAVFNGAFSQPSTVAAAHGIVVNGVVIAPGTGVSLSNFVGKNYSGATNQAISQVTVYPTSDIGFASGNYNLNGKIYVGSPLVTLNLRAKGSAPAFPSDGNVLGSSGVLSNTFSSVTITSSDQVTQWAYVWVEMVTTMQLSVSGQPGSVTYYALENSIGQLSFFSPNGTGTNTGANVEILGPALSNTSPVVTWRLGAFSDTTGYPTCGIYFDGRIYLGGAIANRFDASVSNGINGGTINFAPTDQYGVVAASNAISYTFNSDGVNPIIGMVPDLQGIIMWTQAGEWLVQAPTAGPIAPANITARNVTRHGSANVQPCRTEHTTIFVHRFGKKLLEYFPDVYSGKFSAPNLADKASHIVKKGVAELAYTSAVTPILWGRDTLGALFGVTYKRDSLSSAQPPTFYGWHRHALGSGRVVESICAGPSVGGNLDALTMVTNDAATSTRHVEVMTDTPEEDADLSSAWQLDDAVVASSSSIVASQAGAPYGGVMLNGLWHLNGETVQVFAGGLDCGDRGEKTITDFVVANGAVLVPFGDGISVGPGAGLFTADFYATGPQIIVGFTYNSDGQIVKPLSQADSGARIGPAFAVLTRGHRFGMKLVNTLGLSVGGDLTKKMYPAKFLTPGNKPIPVLTSYSGIIQDTLQDDYGYENGCLAWRISRPYPATVVIVGSNLATQDQ